MKHVSILVPLGRISMSNIESTHQILSHVNGLLMAAGKQPLFNVQMVGVVSPTSQRSGRFSIKPDLLIGEVANTDLVIIPATMAEPAEAIALNQEFIRG